MALRVIYRCKIKVWRPFFGQEGEDGGIKPASEKDGRSVS